MIALGLNQDMYGAGAAIAADGRILFAANEERFTRVKNAGGFPRHSIARALAWTGVDPADVGEVCMAGVMTPPLPFRVFGGLQNRFHEAQDARDDSALRRLGEFVIHHTPITSISAHGPFGRAVGLVVPRLVRRALPPALRHARVRVVEHHACHAACAHLLSGLPESLAITADGMGDGCAITVNHCHGGGMDRLWSAGPAQSLGLFFEMLTEAFGYVPSRDEGKLTGLAAGGDPDRVAMGSPFLWEGERLRYTGPRGRAGVRWARGELIARSTPGDVAAWAQRILEDTVCGIAARWIGRTGLRALVVAGGTFGNVKLNQRLHELPGVDALFVAPNMGDGGNAVGALCAAGHVRPGPIGDVFLGEDFDDAAVAEALRGRDGGAMADTGLNAAIADRLRAGRIVGRFTGRAEWGPRALGNRSILADAADPAISARLNALLARSDFMPFAPAILAERADAYLEIPPGARHAGEFMTLCFRAKDAMRARFPAAVHVDGTARAQLVRAETNPGFHALLRAWEDRTGAPVLLNTSFNIHEDPIVNTPDEALDTFDRARLDTLAAGARLVDREPFTPDAPPAAAARAGAGAP